MYEEIKFSLHEVLSMITGDYDLKQCLKRKGISLLSEKLEDNFDLSKGFDLDNPHFISRDSFIIVQFFKK